MAKYFNPSEIRNLRPRLVSHLDAARESAGIPFNIISGYRASSHNATVGGVPDSAHTTGWAVDLPAMTPEQRFKTISGILAAGFKRIVIGIRLDQKEPGGFRYHNIHVDMDPTKPAPVLSIKIYP